MIGRVIRKSNQVEVAGKIWFFLQTFIPALQDKDSPDYVEILKNIPFIKHKSCRSCQNGGVIKGWRYLELIEYFVFQPLIVDHKKLVRIIICGICYSAIDMLGEVFPWGLVRETIISDCLLTEGWEDHLSVVMFSQCLEVQTLPTLVPERR